MNNTPEKRMKEIVRLMEADDSIDAPIDSIRWVKNLYRTRTADEKQSIIKKLVGALTLDLAPGKAAFGERSGSTAATRQMLFNAGEHAVDLRVTPENSAVDVHGQVLGDGFAGGRVIFQAAEFEKAAQISATSEFKIDRISKGYYKITLTSTEYEIVLEDVDL